MFEEQLKALMNHQSPSGEMGSFLSLIARLRSAVNSNSSLPEQETAFWLQQLSSMSRHCIRRWNLNRNPTSMVIERDAQMAENLIWLKKNRYPNQKIIVWAASFHIVRNPPAIEVLDEPDFYKSTIQMGELVDRSLGTDVFTIGFTANEGRAGVYFRPQSEIEPATEGTLESLFSAADLQNALVPMHKVSGDAAWLNQMLFARPLGYQWMKAQWPKHFDAMIFNRKMSPSTR
jgi:erythromycin esterase